jgi:hypothetical protein
MMPVGLNQTRIYTIARSCLTRRSTTTYTMLHMMFKLGQCTQKNWRRLRGFDYLVKVIRGIEFNYWPT